MLSSRAFRGHLLPTVRMASAGNERFNDEAADWDKNPAVQEATRLAFDTLEPIIQTLSDEKRKSSGTGLNVLEVGCGTGLLTLRVAPLVNEIIAIDPAHGMIEMLKAKTKAINAEEDELRKPTIQVLPVCQLLEDPDDPLLPPLKISPTPRDHGGNSILSSRIWLCITFPTFGRSCRHYLVV